METRERQYRPGERVPGTEYVVIRLEAEGGHGALYLVRHHFLEKKIQMLKTLRSIEPSKDLIERLKREAQMLAAMDHPHIVSVTSGGLTDEKQPRPYFVMERLKGRSLAQIVPEAPEGVGVDAALKVTIEVCDALEYVHVRHGVVHRDIKPDNVFLQVTPRNGSVTKILDFGVAHIMDLEKRYTKNNLFLGTPRYASPEQIMGDKPSPQTDLYAVGLLLYELLLGHGPFDDAQNFAAVATAHVQREPPGFPKNRRFPPGLEALVLSLLRKKAEDRPKSAEWLATQLRQIKRIAEVAERAQSQDLNQTDLSPVQNILTGHRAQLTEAGGPLDVESTPTLADRVGPAGPVNATHPVGPASQTAPPSPLGYRSTMRAATDDAVATPEASIDRAAPTRSLHAELPGAHRNDSDTEQLPGARAWLPPDRTAPPSVGRDPSSSSTAAAVELSRGPAEAARSQTGLIVGLVAALVAALGAVGFYATHGGSKSDRVAASALEKGPVSSPSVVPDSFTSLPSSSSSSPSRVPPRGPTPSPVPSAPSVPSTPPSASASSALPSKAAPRAAPAAPRAAPAPLRVPASGL